MTTDVRYDDVVLTAMTRALTALVTRVFDGPWWALSNTHVLGLPTRALCTGGAPMSPAAHRVTLRVTPGT